jgi:tetratricopeptide (TPR) repeat protein
MPDQSSNLIRSELDRLLESDFLRRSPSHLRLLRYLVERRLANDDGALREMSIGIEVFHRNPATYDPKNDPIVRVNVSRLRERLVKHYAMFEVPPQVRIDLPKGRYVPEFVALGARQLTAPRLLVLPFVSEGRDDALATLLFESTIGELQSVLQLLVLGSRSARAVADDEPLDSARRVNAQAVLSSRIVRLGGENGELYVHTMLLSAPYGHMMASKRYSRAADESDAAFVDRLSRQIRDDCLHAQADLLPGEYIAPPQRKGFAGVPREASDAFVQSRRASALGTADGHLQARNLLQSAIALAPDFAMAHAYLAATMGNLSMYEQVTPGEAWRVGSAASQRALALDPREPSAYLNLAADKIYYEYDFPAARSLLLTARKLAPRHPGVHMLMGTTASYCGELAQALGHLDAAQEVDPLFPAIRANRGVAYYFAGQFDEANRVFVELLTEYPQRTSTRVSLANSLAMCGAYEAARAELNAVIEHDPDDAGARLSLAVVTAREGDRRQAKKIVSAVRASSDIEKTNPSALAGVHAQLGETGEAIKWLTAAADAHEGGFAEAQVDPLLTPLVGQQAFLALLARFGLTARQASAR